MARAGYPVFTKYTDWRGHETQYLRVLDHDHYDKETRRHHWLLLCKVCNKEYTTYSFRIKDRKSCGCNRHAGRFKKKDNFDSGVLLKRAW